MSFDRDREIKVNNIFKNKTIINVDCSAANVWIFTFSDNTSISIWAEDCIQTPAGNIAGIFLESELGDTFADEDNLDCEDLVEDEDELLQDE